MIITFENADLGEYLDRARPECRKVYIALDNTANMIPVTREDLEVFVGGCPPRQFEAELLLAALATRLDPHGHRAVGRPRRWRRRTGSSQIRTSRLRDPVCLLFMQAAIT